MNRSSTSPASGLPYALGAHAVWGSMPLYLLLVQTVPPLEFVAWRLVFTLPLCLVFVAATRSWKEFVGVLRDRRAVLTLFGSASMVAVNWWLYVWAIHNGHVYAASLGYYILPLMMMLLGLVVLGERLTRRQWAAVALAGLGVGILAIGALTTMWLSVSMAVTFGVYGLLRKTVAAGPLAGLTVESMILYPVALGIVGWYWIAPEGSAIFQGWDVALMPFALNESTRFISPTKTPEYLAGGRPVVSTPIRDVVNAYGESGVVRIADTPTAFIRAVEAALRMDPRVVRLRADKALDGMSWDKTCAAIREHIECLR